MESENSQLETSRQTESVEALKKKTHRRHQCWLIKHILSESTSKKLRLVCNCSEQRFRLRQAGVWNAKARPKPQNSTMSARTSLSKRNSKIAEGDENTLYLTRLRPGLFLFWFLIKAVYAARNCTTRRSPEMMNVLFSSLTWGLTSVFIKQQLGKSHLLCYHGFSILAEKVL